MDDLLREFEGRPISDLYREIGRLRAEIERLTEHLDVMNKWNEQYRAALEFASTFQILDSSRKDVAEDSLHEIRKTARKALNQS